ncbi:MAG: hypothetical protein KatS3mg109_0049 [Pirellulaceae bacterium]|nr:MAG: hypothetical protein KatS3mg109_0049 [Pirellulaceae bacterium]
MAAQKFFQSNTDPTKELRLDVDNITTATARVWTIPDQDIDFGLSGLQSATISAGDFLLIRDATDGLLKRIDASQLIVTNPLSFRGGWDASSGLFPGGGTAQTGYLYKVTVAGIVDGVSFAVGDSIYATTNNASTTTYANNWLKVENISDVISVFGRAGNVTAQAGDYTASQITNVPAGGISSTTVQAAINELDVEKLSVSLTNGRIFVGNVSNVASPVQMTGDVTITNTGATNVVYASTSVAGKVRLATSAEVAAGTSSALAVTPAGLAANYTLTSDLASTASGKGASLIGIADAGGNFTGTTVEAALAELAASSAPVGNASTTVKGLVELATASEASALAPPSSGDQGPLVTPTNLVAFHMAADGSAWAIRGKTASPTSTGWSVSSLTVNKTLDADAVTLQQLADFVGSLASELLNKGIISA